MEKINIDNVENRSSIGFSSNHHFRQNKHVIRLADDMTFKWTIKKRKEKKRDIKRNNKENG
jgi:hypothetical protein